MSRWVLAGWLCFAGSVVLAAEPEEKKEEAGVKQPEAVEILTKADAATKAVKTVRYDFAFKATGAAQARSPEMTGKAVLGGEAEQGLGKFFVDVTVKATPSAEERRFQAGTNGDVSFLVDFTTKMAHEDLDPAVMGSDQQFVGLVAMLEYTHPRPFSDEINGKTVELKGTETIGGVECHHVFVEYTTAAQKADWWFGKDDSLPRRVDRHFASRSGEAAGRSLVLSNVVADPKMEKDPFVLTVPEGFTKTDEFAPDRRNLQPVGR